MKTVEEIITNPSLINTLNIDECERFLKDKLVFNVRTPGFKELRDAAHIRISDVKREEALRKAEEKRIQKAKEAEKRAHNSAMKVYNRCITTFNCMRDTHLWLDEVDEEWFDEHVNMYGRIISCAVHSCHNVVLGLHSERSIRGEDDPTFEHCFPRQWSGENIVRTIYAEKEEFTFEQFVFMMFYACHVTVTTRRENMELLPYQKVATFMSPKDAYEQASIQLQRLHEFDMPDPWIRVFEMIGVDAKEVEPYDGFEEFN